MPDHELLFDDGERRKFWEIEARGREVVTAWGRVGTDGQSKTKKLASAEAAAGYVKKLVAEKRGKGYVATAHARLHRVSRETRAAAKRLVWVETTGGPVLVLPEALAPDWNGAFDATGEYVFEREPCDYDRACARGTAVSTLDVGAGKALVMGSIGPVAWAPEDDGGMLLLWVASDTAAALLELARALPASAYRKTRPRFDVRGGDEVLLLDAARRGRTPGSKRARRTATDYRCAETHTFELRRGRYVVEDAGGVRGAVVDGARLAEVSAEVVRLRRAR